MQPTKESILRKIPFHYGGAERKKIPRPAFRGIHRKLMCYTYTEAELRMLDSEVEGLLAEKKYSFAD